MAVAYKRTEVHQVCYVMAVLVHYFILVSLSALGVYPIMVSLRIFRRMWYEKEWLIAPFATVCWGEYGSTIINYKLKGPSHW